MDGRATHEKQSFQIFLKKSIFHSFQAPKQRLFLDVRFKKKKKNDFVFTQPNNFIARWHA